jgi:hypothetical protein
MYLPVVLGVKIEVIFLPDITATININAQTLASCDIPKATVAICEEYTISHVL